MTDTSLPARRVIGLRSFAERFSHPCRVALQSKGRVGQPSYFCLWNLETRGPAPAALTAALGQRLLLLRFRWLCCAAFQFDYDQIKSVVAGVLRQVGSAGGVLCVACLGGKAFLFPVRIAELPLGVGEEHGCA